jgi:hypothetical protein
MMGVPVVIKLTDFVVTWEDASVRYEYIEDDLLKTKEEMNFTWDNASKCDGNEMTWYVRHTDNKYCWQQRGFVKDIEEVLVFLPYVGFYDVSCVVLDGQNFPMMRKKKKYIEVLKSAPDFVAFGRFLDPGTTLDQHYDDNWNQFEGTWESNSYCPKSTEWDDALINWDSLNYQYYLNQDFVKNYTTSKVLEIDERYNLITLQGPEFYYNQEKVHQKWRNNLILENSPKNVPIKSQIDVVKFDKQDNIIITGKWNMIPGDKLNLYKYFETQQFTINNNEIKIATDYEKGFEIGKTITLLTALEGKQYKYSILDVEVDYTYGVTIVTVEDDTSLNDLPFNRLIYRGEDNLYKILNCVYDSDNHETTVNVNDTNHYISRIAKKISAGSGMNTISDWKVEYGILSGYYPFDVLSVELIDNNSIVRIHPNSHLCYTDVRFVAKFDEYDMDWALKHANSRAIVWANLDFVKYNDTEHQSWNMAEYHGDPILGFKIIQFRDKGILYFNGVSIAYDISTYGENDKWYFLADQLNNHTNNLVTNFNYTVVQNSYIHAVAKASGIRHLVSLDSSRGTIISKDSYPKLNFDKWEDEFYPGDNNPAIFQPIKRTWELNHSTYVNINNSKNLALPYNWGVTGAFNFNDTFISRKDFTIPKYTTVFVVFDNLDDITLNTKFYWELWEESRNKLIMKSDKKYILFNFIESGVYSVHLKITDEKGNTSTHIKKSWINCTNL